MISRQDDKVQKQEKQSFAATTFFIVSDKIRLEALLRIEPKQILAVSKSLIQSSAD